MAESRYRQKRFRMVGLGGGSEGENDYRLFVYRHLEYGNELANEGPPLVKILGNTREPSV